MEKSKYINPFTDFGFKKIFGEESNKDLLLNFLNELLRPQGVVINKLTYKKDTKLPKSAEDRKVIFDLFCENENGDKFTIELQKAKQEHFQDRLLYYSTFSIQEQGKRGKWDYRLNAVYIVAILDFFFEQTVTKKVVSYYKMLDLDTHEPFSGKLNFVTVEMPHFNKEEHELETNLDKWLYLLKHLGTLERIPPVLQISILEKVFKVAEYAGMSRTDREEYEASLKRYNDLYQSLSTAEKDGYGKAEKKLLPQIEKERKLKAEALALAEKEKAEKEKEKAEKEKERAEKEKALKLAESNRAALAQTAKLLLSMNVSKADIAKNIGITSSELEDLLS
jgi:predicted transposase/invertase (TIGR01784 family)